MVLSEEAVKALELMPVQVLSHEQEEESTDSKQMETIKYTTNSLRKLSYASHYCTGSGGLEEVVPHAIFTEQAVNELEQVNNLEKALAFKKSCAGIALKNANISLAALRAGLNNTDNNVDPGPNVVFSTFHDFVVHYCNQEGHTEDRYNQREGLKHLRKPTPVRVQRWLTIVQEKNDLILYLQGTGDKYDDDEMRRIFYKTMPLKWQDEFTSNGNNDIGTASLSTIVTFMKQQEARARAKVAANKAKQLAGSSDDRGKAPGKRRNDRQGWENPKKKGRRNNRHGERKNNNKHQERSDHGDKNGEMCTRCVHKHLRKHCLYNPNNPKNILGKLAAKAKKNPSDSNEESHSNHITIDVDVDENHNHMGFQSSNNKGNKPPKGHKSPRAYDPAFECLKGSNELFAWVALRETTPERVKELWEQSERKRCK